MLVITPYCSELDMPIRLLTTSHCAQKGTDECAPDKCDCFKIRLSCPVI